MLRAACLVCLLLLAPSIGSANARLTVLMDVLRVEEAIEILRNEGLAYAEVLESDLLDGRGGAFWDSQLRQIYAVEQIREALRAALDARLSPRQVEASIAFFAVPPGVRIIELETAARRAMSDPDVAAAARELHAEQLAEDSPKLRLATELMTATDLVARNVAGTMNADLRFYTGLADGGYMDQSVAEIIADAWTDAEAIRSETESWLGAFLSLAYDSVTADDLRHYIAFAESPAGQALNAALFEGFEGVSRDISYALGRAVALNADGDEI